MPPVPSTPPTRQRITWPRGGQPSGRARRWSGVLVLVAAATVAAAALVWLRAGSGRGGFAMVEGHPVGGAFRSIESNRRRGVWVIDNNDRIVRLDPTTGNPGSAVFSAPDQALLGVTYARGLLWVVGDTGQVSRVDPLGRRPTKSFYTNAHPISRRPVITGSGAWIATTDQRAIGIDTTAPRPPASVTLHSVPTDLAGSATTVFVLGSSTVDRINAVHGTLDGTAKLGELGNQGYKVDTAKGIGVGPHGVWVGAQMSDGHAAVIHMDPKSLVADVHELPINGSTYDVAEAKGVLWVAAKTSDARSTILELNPSTVKELGPRLSLATRQYPSKLIFSSNALWMKTSTNTGDAIVRIALARQ